MKKYLDQVISLNVLVNAPEKSEDTKCRIQTLYEALIIENAKMLEETKQFFQHGEKYYNFHDSQVLSKEQNKKCLVLEAQVHTFERGVAKVERVRLNIEMRVLKMVKIDKGDIIHRVAVHNNQLGVILKRQGRPTMFSDIIDFKTIALTHIACEKKKSIKL